MHSLLLLLLFLLLSQACRAESHIVLRTGTVREEARGSPNCVCVAGGRGWWKYYLLSAVSSYQIPAEIHGWHKYLHHYLSNLFVLQSCGYLEFCKSVCFLSLLFWWFVTTVTTQIVSICNFFFTSFYCFACSWLSFDWRLPLFVVCCTTHI